MKPKCEDCRYWEPKDAEVGYCHRNAPSSYLDEDGKSAYAYWPITADDDWCGEFKPKEGECLTSG